MGRFRVDLTGQRFGRLVVVSYAESKQNKAYWNVQCDCGKMDTARSDRLRLGRKKSCGCLFEEVRLLNLVSTNRNPSKKENYKNALLAILNIAINENNNLLVDIAINSLHGFELDDKYLEDAKDGLELFKFTLSNETND